MNTYFLEKNMLCNAICINKESNVVCRAVSSKDCLGEVVCFSLILLLLLSFGIRSENVVSEGFIHTSVVQEFSNDSVNYRNDPDFKIIDSQNIESVFSNNQKPDSVKRNEIDKLIPSCTTFIQSRILTLKEQNKLPIFSIVVLAEGIFEKPERKSITMKELSIRTLHFVKENPQGIVNLEIECGISTDQVNSIKKLLIEAKVSNINTTLLKNWIKKSSHQE